MNDVDAGGELTGDLTAVDDEALSRRLTRLARAGAASESNEWEAIQTELARRRLEDLPPSPPLPRSLRSQLLSLLADSPGSTPSQLAGVLQRSTTVVSRVLGVLLEAGVVSFQADPHDGRVRHYQLVAQDSSSRAKVAPATPSEKEQEYVGLVIATAIRARRRTNDLGYAADRLQRALDRAVEINADNLALIARRELIATLRQAGRTSDADEHFDALRAIELGQSTVAPHLIAPAIACLDYELGLQTSKENRERLEHLTTAATAFRRCGPLNEATDWCPREGWALLASASLWREETEFGIALAHAERAETVFRTYDDTYGSAEAARLQGFCHRLRGDFGAAITTLERATVLAKEAVSDRCLADVLLQLGDAHRCNGHRGMAEEHLAEAAAIALRLNRTRTLGFALTAIAAVAFEADEFGNAWTAADRAESYLTTSLTGTALNTRRKAVIARELARLDRTQSAEISVPLFARAADLYRQMNSPAGVAACCVGLSRQVPSKETGSAVEDLVKVARSGRGRLLLPMDPWVPNLLQQWAEETGDDEVKRVADWSYSSDKPHVHASEMAGEPRTESLLLVA